MEICGQYFSRETLRRIEGELEREPGLSRRELARRVCRWLEWRSPKGQLKEMSCRKALVELHRRGVLTLPECRQAYGFRKRREGWEDKVAELPEGREVSCSLEELGGVEVIPVPGRSSKLSKIWRRLMERDHYLGSGPLCGAQIRYLVRREQYGWVGGLSFSGATWRLRAREEWIGWSEGARRAHLPEVANSQSSMRTRRVRGMQQPVFDFADGAGAAPGFPCPGPESSSSVGGLGGAVRVCADVGGDLCGSGPVSGNELPGGELDSRGADGGSLGPASERQSVAGTQRRVSVSFAPGLAGGVVLRAGEWVGFPLRSGVAVGLGGGGIWAGGVLR